MCGSVMQNTLCRGATLVTLCQQPNHGTMFVVPKKGVYYRLLSTQSVRLTPSHHGQSASIFPACIVDETG